MGLLSTVPSMQGLLRLRSLWSLVQSTLFLATLVSRKELIESLFPRKVAWTSTLLVQMTLWSVSQALSPRIKAL